MPPGPAAAPVRRVAVSVVSHGHGALVQELLHALAALAGASIAEVVLTHNLPEPVPPPPPGGWPFALTVIAGGPPQGFAANHNRAFARTAAPYFCVLNPDLRFPDGDPFPALLQAAAAPAAGCAYPVQVDAAGRRLDFERALPTPAALWRRHALRRPDTRTDWVNAACLLVPRGVFAQLGGFDARYFMYCEDVDFCLRLRLAGLALQPAPVRVQHDAQRASRRRLRHLGWHLRSLWRLWHSAPYRKTLAVSGSSRARLG